jgi:hypothetical protein
LNASIERARTKYSNYSDRLSNVRQKLSDYRTKFQENQSQLQAVAGELGWQWQDVTNDEIERAELRAKVREELAEAIEKSADDLTATMDRTSEEAARWKAAGYTIRARIYSEQVATLRVERVLRQTKAAQYRFEALAERISADKMRADLISDVLTDKLTAEQQQALAATDAAIQDLVDDAELAVDMEMSTSAHAEYADSADALLAAEDALDSETAAEEEFTATEVEASVTGESMEEAAPVVEGAVLMTDSVGGVTGGGTSGGNNTGTGGGNQQQPRPTPTPPTAPESDPPPDFGPIGEHLKKPGRPGLVAPDGKPLYGFVETTRQVGQELNELGSAVQGVADFLNQNVPNTDLTVGELIVDTAIAAVVIGFAAVAGTASIPFAVAALVGIALIDARVFSDTAMMASLEYQDPLAEMPGSTFIILSDSLMITT